MEHWIALLRAVNVGGTGKLPMAALRLLCEQAGCHEVRSYIASGNVVFRRAGSERSVKAALEAALAVHAGKHVGVLVRSGAQMRAVLADNPFGGAPGNRVVTLFLDQPPPSDALAGAKHLAGEQLALGTREIYIHYGDGDAMRASRLALPAFAQGTARNMNTVARLADMAAP